jgi:hypothetical protein
VKTTKNTNEHQLRRECISMSEFMKRICRLVSEESGKNINGQVSISHGIQVLIAREAKRRGCKIKELELYTA